MLVLHLTVSVPVQPFPTMRPRRFSCPPPAMVTPLSWPNMTCVTHEAISAGRRTITSIARLSLSSAGRCQRKLAPGRFELISRKSGNNNNVFCAPAPRKKFQQSFFGQTVDRLCGRIIVLWPISPLIFDFDGASTGMQRDAKNRAQTCSASVGT